MIGGPFAFQLDASTPPTIHVALPTSNRSRREHGAREVLAARQNTKGPGSIAACSSSRDATHGLSGHSDMPGRQCAPGAPKKRNQCCSSLLSTRIRAWMTRRTRAVEFPGRNSSDPEPRPFRTPNRPIPIPNGGRGAEKG